MDKSAIKKFAVWARRDLRPEDIRVLESKSWTLIQYKDAA